MMQSKILKTMESEAKKIELRDGEGKLRFTIYNMKQHVYGENAYWIVKGYPEGEGVGLTTEQFIDLLERYWVKEF